MLFRLITLALLGTMCMYARVANADFNCEIVDAVNLQDTGVLGHDGHASSLKEASKGRILRVESATGKLSGTPGVRNFNAFGTPGVIDPGSSEQAFKAVTIYAPNRDIDYLRVDVFVAEAKKPFIFVSGSTVVTGLCEVVQAGGR